MDFDEYEYLEKSVEDPDARSKKKEINGEKREKGYRKREEAEDDDREVGEEDRKRKKSRNDEDNGGERKREDRERSERRREKEGRHRGDRVRDGDRERDRDRDRDRDRVRDGERGRDRDRERRDREKGRDRERREREKEKESGNVKVKEEEKEREREREGLRQSSSRSKRHESPELEREKERETERERERLRRSSSRAKEEEKERERERERRSSSRSRRHESRERERDKERELREIETRDGIGRRFKDKKEAVEPEADPERDQRTVFAYQMPLKATERDVYEFFSKAGKVRDVRLIMDRNSRRSKGVGYVEFYDAMSVPMAIALSGQLFLGQPVMVKPSEAEKNLVQSTASGSSVTGPFGPADRKLYVGNLHFNMSEQDLRQIFESFGPVELVQLPLDLETGHCKGFGFVQFAQVEHAKTAVSLNGKLELAGRYIKVSSVTEHIGGQEAGTTAADFDDDDGGGLALNARSRALLMQKLDRTGTASSIVGSLGVPVHNGSTPIQQPFPLPLNGQTAIPAPSLPGQVLPAPVTEPVGTPSECLLLKNLFDPATETDPEFDLDIKDDVEGECSKFGEVRHIYVDKHSAGHVYLRFINKEAAMKAQSQMHLRWFARRLISAVFMQPLDYEAKFRDGA